MGDITIGGLGSGLDTNSIIDALVKQASVRKTGYADEQLKINAQQESMNDMSVKLLSFQATLNGIKNPETFKAHIANSSNETVLTAKATENSFNGSYNINVLNLASNSSVSGNIFTKSASVVDKAALDAQLAAVTVDGTFTINGEVFDTFDSVGGVPKTLDQLIAEVNGNANANVIMDYDVAGQKFSLISKDNTDINISETPGGGQGLFSAMDFSYSTVGESVSVTTSSAWADAGFTKPVDGIVTINGKSFDPNAYTTVDDFINVVNADADANVTMDYNAGAFSIKSDSIGEKFTLSETGENGFFTAAKIKTVNIFSSDPTQTMENGRFIEEIVDGEFKINGVSFTYDVSVDSVNDLIQEINSSDAGVAAFFDKVTGTFSISAKDTGNRSIVFQDVSGNFLKANGLYDSLNSGIGVSKAGQDAKFEFNGVTTTRTSNDFTINGMELTLKSTGNTTLNVNADLEGITEVVKKVVDEYNELVDLVKEKLAEQPLDKIESKEDLKVGSLQSNGVLQELEETLRSVVSTFVSDLTTDYNEPGDVGITTGAFGGSVDSLMLGHIYFNQSTFKDALENNQEKVAKLFTKHTNTVTGATPTKMDTLSASFEEVKIGTGFLNASETLDHSDNFGGLMGAGTLTVNGVDFAYDGTTNLQTFMDTINSNSTAKVTMLYDSVADRFKITNDRDPSDPVVDISVSDTGNFKSLTKITEMTIFSLPQEDINPETAPKVIVGGNAYNQLFGSDSVPESNQFLMNYGSGQFVVGGIFQESDVSVNYDYTIDSGDTLGLGYKIYNAIRSFTKVNTGALDEAIASLQTEYLSFSDKIADEDIRVDLYKERLLAQFSAMESTMAQLNSQADYMASQISSMSSMRSKK